MKPAKPDGTLPLLPLRDLVVYPKSVVKIYVGRAMSMEAVNCAIDTDNLLLVSTQKKAETNTPGLTDLYETGTIGRVIRLQGLPDGTARVVLEGTDKFRLQALDIQSELILGNYRLIDQPKVDTQELQKLFQLLTARAREYAQLRQQKESLLDAVNDLAAKPYNLFDFVVNMLPLSIEEKYQLLICQDPIEMVSSLIAQLDGYLDLHKLDESLQQRVRNQINHNQREYYLNEQLKAVQREISEIDGGKADPNEIMAERIDKAKMTSEGAAKAREELTKLRSMSPMSSESAVIRNYLDVLIGLPWYKRTKPNYDTGHAQVILDRDHYGLKDVKERIVEYIAAYKRSKGKVQAPILCLVGPPGVGKTSLARSIAESVNRKFVRMALGGVRDESEIRGHRRTYIGSMPGRIIQKISKAKVINPLFLFDEVDKMGMDFRGDPASALLEVLDPEQNSKFNDHYLEVDYDLSKVLFICTSNSMNIPEALLDRLEIIRIAGYTEIEKTHIAKRHLLPQLLRSHSCKPGEVDINDAAIHTIIGNYTREAGVRALERELAKIIRKSLLKLDQNPNLKTVEVDANNLDEFLGPPKFENQELVGEHRLGVVNGLAWTKYGGHILQVETALFPGKGECIVTGSVGDVMRESVRAAMSVCRARSYWLKLPENFFAKHDFHIHVPEGATPKDGPSAGITMCVALFSLLSGMQVTPKITMTGELTISGSILPIGGLKEKLLAAHRAGVKKVFIPAKNAKDLVEIPQEVLDALEIIKVGDINDLLAQTIVGFHLDWLSMPQSFVLEQAKPPLPQTEPRPGTPRAH